MVKVELLGALDYKKVEKVLKEFVTDEEDLNRLLKELKEIEIAVHSEKVATAGRLSRFAGDVFEVLGISEDKTYLEKRIIEVEKKIKEEQELEQYNFTFEDIMLKRDIESIKCFINFFYELNFGGKMA